MGCSPPGSLVHGILQVRVLEWVAISFSRGSSRPRDGTRVSCIAGRFFLLGHQGRGRSWCVFCVFWGLGRWLPGPLGVGRPAARILEGLQVLSRLQSCLSCRPGYHLPPPGGMGTQGMPVGPVGQLCSTRPPHVLMPTRSPTWAPSQCPLWESWL